MPTTLERRRLRIKCDTSSFDGLQDAKRSAPIKLWLSNDVQIEGAAFFGSAIVEDVSNWGSVTLEVKPVETEGQASDPATVPVMTKTVTSFDGATTDATWTDDTKAHFVIPFTDVETSLLKGKYWMVLTLITTDTPGRTITLAAGGIEFVEDGYHHAGTAAVLDETAYSKSVADARFALAVGSLKAVATPAGVTGPGLYVIDGGKLHLWDPDAGQRGSVRIIFDS